MTEVLIGLGVLFGATVTLGLALGIAVLVFAMCLQVADNIRGD